MVAHSLATTQGAGKLVMAGEVELDGAVTAPSADRLVGAEATLA